MTRSIADWFSELVVYRSQIDSGCKSSDQGRNEVTWRPGQEESLAPPVSNMKSFRSKCSLLYWRKCLWYFGIFWHQCKDLVAQLWLGTRRILPPLPPLVTPLFLISDIGTYFYSLLCKKKHNKFEKSIVIVRLKACPVYVDHSEWALIVWKSQ